LKIDGRGSSGRKKIVENGGNKGIWGKVINSWRELKAKER